MTPRPRAAMPGPMALLHRKAPVRPTARSCVHVSIGKFSKRENSAALSPSTFGLRAAWLSKMSMLPRVPHQRGVHPLGVAGTSDIDFVAEDASANFGQRLLATSHGFAAGMSASTDTPPALQMASACCRPSKPAPPVMTATRLSSRNRSRVFISCAVWPPSATRQALVIKRGAGAEARKVTVAAISSSFPETVHGQHFWRRDSA